MAEIHCFTSASFSYLDRARVLAQTLREFHPEWKIWFCLSDHEPPGFSFDLASEPFDGVVRVEELGIPNTSAWIFKHDVVELCTAVKGAMLLRLLENGAEKVVYLDPDIALFNDLSPVIDHLDRSPIVLTPHQTDPEEDEIGVLDNEIGSLKHGVYNLGFIAVRSCPTGLRFARWWRDRLVSHCYDDIPNGLFTDQRWCDLIPAFFDGVHILRDPGYNVASWNLGRRPIKIHTDGTITAGGRPLRFFHFTKVNTVGERMLERYSGGRYEIFELLHWYRGRLAANAAINLPDRWWFFGTYADGRPIERKERLLYRVRQDLQRSFPMPFATGSNSYIDWYDQDAKERTCRNAA